MSADKLATTASILGAYRRELAAEEVDPPTVQTLVIEAARSLLRDDPLVVKAECSCSSCRPHKGPLINRATD